MSRPRLALFDCDGTLADSQHHIVTAMHIAFLRCGLQPPADSAIRRAIGLSLPRVILELAPLEPASQRAALVEAYRSAYLAARSAPGAEAEPLYTGIDEAIARIRAEGWLLGVATGKSSRGLTRLLDAHGMLGSFATLQTADSHPSKPDPAMAVAAMQQAGVAPEDTVVIGDTAYDMAMACAAGARALGVAWGYHAPADLARAGALAVAGSPADLPAMLRAVMEKAA